MRFTNQLLIAVTIFSVFSSAKSFAALSCEDLMNPNGEYSAAAAVRMNDMIQAKQNFLRALGNFLGLDLLTSDKNDWHFSYLAGSSSPMGFPRALSVEILTYQVPTDSADLSNFVVKAQDLKSNERFFYNQARVSIEIKKVGGLRNPLFNFYFNDDTALDNYSSVGNVFEANIRSYLRTRHGVETKLRIVKKGGLLEVTIFNKRNGAFGWINWGTTFVAQNNTWLDKYDLP
jgi:hypothetical protein